MSNGRRQINTNLDERQALHASGLEFCFRCSNAKPLAEFPVNRSRKIGVGTECRDCKKSRLNQWREANPEKALESGRRSYYKTQEHQRTRAMQQRLQNFGLTIAQYDEMFERQGGLCRICGEAETVAHNGRNPSRLAVDHDRACCSGKKSCGKCVRGLLCFRCNTALGKLEANIHEALAYLRHYGSAL